MADSVIKERLYFLGTQLLQELLEQSQVQQVAPGTVLLKEGQYIKVVPIVLDGLVKVFTQYEDKELLLYYIQPDQSCIMSFSSAVNQAKSKIFAIAEEESLLLLMPATAVAGWIDQYPQFNHLFYRQYDLRYAEMIDTINGLLYHKLDHRLLQYLKDKTVVTGKNPLKIAHKDIANEMGTAREVITRLIKKLEIAGHVQQTHEGLHIF